MPNPQQPELARNRRASSISDDAAPADAATRSKRSRKGAPDEVGPTPEANRPGHQPDAVPDKPLVPPDAYRADDGRADAEAHEASVADGPPSVRFPFLFEPVFRPFAAAVGVLPPTAWVRVDDDELVVRFGPWILRTPRDNVAGCDVTGPYRFLKVVGPPHLSLADGGITLATSRRAGACIRFHEPVPCLLPRRLVRHTAATVTVSNPADLARRLTA